MSNERQDVGKPDPNPKAQTEKKDAENENLNERELRTIAGGALQKGHKPPPPSTQFTPF